MDTPSLPPGPPPNQDGDKPLAILCHVSIFLGVGLILPLIVLLVKREESPLVAAHAKEVLNFHVSLLIYCVCTIPFVLILCCFPIWIPICMGLGLFASICAIIGAIKASEGGFFFYPLTIRFIT